MVKDIDADGNATIEFEEFVAMMGDKVSGKDGVDEMKKAFKLFDTESKGKFGLKELMAIAKDIGDTTSEADLQEVLNECGGGATVDEEQFVKIMEEQGLC